MNKYQEALEWMKSQSGWIDPYEFSEAHQALYTELLERATPKKPIIERSFGVTHDRCPVCDTTVVFVNDNPGADPVHDFKHNFCPKCGQAVDRSKDELPREEKNE